MTFILVIATAAIVLILELARRTRRRQSQKELPKVLEHPISYEVTERYFHPAHTWVAVSNWKKEVTVGADDFSERLVGTLTRIDLPKTGQNVRQGEIFARLHHGERVLTQSAPVSGTITEVNDTLNQKPTLLNDSPLDKGWLAKIVPTNLGADLRNLLSGVTAEAWRSGVHAELIQFFSPRMGTVLQDGGQMVRDFTSQLNDAEWNSLIRKFFPSDSEHLPQNKHTN